MSSYLYKKKESLIKSDSVQKKSSGKNQGLQLKDNRDQSTVQKKENKTGLPDNLKSGIENLSGHSMDDVKVHYNSDKPAQLNAHAYAQGTDIHIASGQEKHLAHEAWHVVQQKQGRVKPTAQMKNKVNVNDDKGLEKEADVMGIRALSQSKRTRGITQKKSVSLSVKQFIFGTRWYEYDGENYIPRRIGLPGFTGWVKLPNQHEGLDAYISIHNIARMPQLQQAEEGIQQIRDLVNEQAPLIGGIAQGLQHQQYGLAAVQQAQAQFLNFTNALGQYLTQTSTFVKLLGVVLGLTVTVIGGVLLSYLTLPPILVGIIEGASFLYGCGLLYRWLKSDLLHPFAKVALLSVNIAAMALGAGLTIAQIIAYLTNIIHTAPFQHVQFAAIPFALLIEHLLVVMLEKVNALRIAYNQQNGHHEDHIA
jgi:hypothetical protein